MVSNSGILITWQQLLYVGILLLSFYVVELLFFWLRHGRGKGQDKQQLIHLQQEITDLHQELDTLKVRLAALAAQWQDPDVLDAVPSSPKSRLIEAESAPESPYAQAIRLAKTGVEADELVSICAISRGEADLIVAIYRSAQRG